MSIVENVKPASLLLADGQKRTLTPEEAERVALVLDGPMTWSPEQAAHALGVSRPMVVRWINEGLLEDQPVGKHHRVPVESVLALARSRKSAGAYAVKLVEDAKSDPAVAASLTDVRARAAEMVKRRDSAK